LLPFVSYNPIDFILDDKSAVPLFITYRSVNFNESSVAAKVYLATSISEEAGVNIIAVGVDELSVNVAEPAPANVYNGPFDGGIIALEGKFTLLASLASIADKAIWNNSPLATAVEKSATTLTVTSLFLVIFTFISLKSAFQVDIFFVETVSQLIINLTFVTLVVFTLVEPPVANVNLVTVTSDTSLALIEN
jgi:hypothetical protein